MKPGILIAIILVVFIIIIVIVMMKSKQSAAATAAEAATTQAAALPAPPVSSQLADLRYPTICANKCFVLHPFSRTKREECINNCKTA